MIWAGRIASALPAIAFAMSGGMKLIHHPRVVEGFGKFGYSEGMLTPLGIVELTSLILYLVPKTAVLGAVLLTGYLGGAIATHLRAGEPFIAPLVLGVLVWAGLFLRDERIRALLPLRKSVANVP
ncbi:MAG: DoxX family protein [Polyangiales bacterium]